MKQPNGVNRKFTCNKCGLTKVSRMFGKDRKSKTGYFCWCKSCANAHYREYKRAASHKPINRSRFLVFMGYVVRGENECHGWTGTRTHRDDRPTFYDKNNRMAARWICEYFWGPAPIDEKGQPYDAHHLCLNDDCTNGLHIRWVSKKRHREIHDELRRLEKAAA